MTGSFRVERFFVAPALEEFLANEGLVIRSVEQSAEGVVVTIELEEESNEDEVTLVGFGGCEAIGVGGYHSDGYGEPGGRCAWCGATGPNSGE